MLILPVLIFYLFIYISLSIWYLFCYLCSITAAMCCPAFYFFNFRALSCIEQRQYKTSPNTCVFCEKVVKLPKERLDEVLKCTVETTEVALIYLRT